MAKNMALLLIAGVLMVSCKGHQPQAATTDVAATATLLYSSTQCGVNEAGETTQSLGSNQQLTEMYRRIQQPGFIDTPNVIPTVDFEQRKVLAVFMGKKPTSGYALKLSDTAIYKGSSPYIKIERVVPDKNANLLMMGTSPCLLISVPKGVGVIFK